MLRGAILATVLWVRLGHRPNMCGASVQTLAGALIGLGASRGVLVCATLPLGG